MVEGQREDGDGHNHGFFEQRNCEDDKPYCVQYWQSREEPYGKPKCSRCGRSRIPLAKR